MAEYCIFQQFFDSHLFIERGNDILNDKNKIDEFGSQIPSKFFQKIPLEEKIDHCFLNKLNISQILFLNDEDYLFRNDEDYLFRNDYLEILLFFNFDLKKNLYKIKISGNKIRKYFLLHILLNKESYTYEDLLFLFVIGDLEAVKFLYEKNIIPTYTNNSLFLKAACESDNYDLVNYLIEIGLNPNQINGLFYINNVEILKLLIKHQFNMHADIFLDQACYKNNLEIIKYLVQNGTQFQNHHFISILKYKNIQSITFCIENGYDYNSNKDLINNILFMFSISGDFSMINFLLKIFKFDKDFLEDLLFSIQEGFKEYNNFIVQKIIQIFINNNIDSKKNNEIRVKTMIRDIQLKLEFGNLSFCGGKDMIYR